MFRGGLESIFCLNVDQISYLSLPFPIGLERSITLRPNILLLCGDIVITMAYTPIQTAIVTVHWTLTSVAAVLMAARLYVRLRLRPGSFGWDDL